nr:dienelactone hydrolase family protein [Sphingobium boeckii]
MVYDGPGGPFEGVVAWDDALSGPRPGVMVIPNVLGQKEFDNVRAERLAARGYVGFAVDLFGQGERTTRDDPDMMRYINLLGEDRGLLRDRLLSAHATLKSLPEVDSARTAAIGFCFGGKSVLDLARAGADVAGVVSFHGVYDAPPFPNAAITAKILVCHGWEDPLCPPEATVALAQELNEAGVDWQIHAYGQTGHAFTDSGLAATGNGFGWSEAADRRSWKAMENFLEEIFG